MGKIIFWIVVVFLVLFALRMYNVAKANRRRAGRKPSQPVPEAMVRCVQCGVFLPKPDAQAAVGGYLCSDPACSAGRPR